MTRLADGLCAGIKAFENSTALDTDRLRRMCLDAVAAWRMDGLAVRIRYSRSADFSGTCYYRQGRIFVNLGRHLTYPYRMGTHVARTHSDARHWWKPIYTLNLADGYQVVLFVFLHECFHLLVQRARRNPRQKESMCDRFATRILVDTYGLEVCDEKGRPVRRRDWDFQDLDRFIVGARRTHGQTAPTAPPNRVPSPPQFGAQFLLFESEPRSSGCKADRRSGGMQRR